MHKKTIFIAILSLLSTSAVARGLGQFWSDHNHRLSVACNAGGLGSNNAEAFSVGLFTSIYGFTANVSYGVLDDFDNAYPFCKQHVRQEPILSEYLFGYSFPVWSNFSKELGTGYTVYLAPVGGFFQKEYSYVKSTDGFKNQQTNRYPTFGVIATLEFYSGTILNIRGTQYGGEIGIGYSFFSPYRR